jgi:small-conductance mechanosensitive channel
MEQTGSTLFSTLSGILLDSNHPGDKPSETTFQYLLNAFLTLNVLQYGTILLLVYLQYHKIRTSKRIRSRRSSFGDSDVRGSTHSPDRTSRPPNDSDESPLLTTDHQQYLSSGSTEPRPLEHRKNQSELRRGVFIAILCTVLVVLAWILFMLTAWYKLGQRKGEH